MVPRERSQVCRHALWQLYVPLGMEMCPTRESPGSLLPSEPNRFISPSFHNPPLQYLPFTHWQWAQWQISSQGLCSSLLRLQTPLPWIWEQGSQGGTSSPGHGSWRVPALGGSPGEVAFWLSWWCWALTPGCSHTHPWSRYPRNTFTNATLTFLCHTSSCVGFAPGQGVRARNSITAPQSQAPALQGETCDLMHTLDSVIFFIFAADLLATWVANIPCMRMAMNCFDFQVGSGSTWWQEKAITKTVTISY